MCMGKYKSMMIHLKEYRKSASNCVMCLACMNILQKGKCVFALFADRVTFGVLHVVYSFTIVVVVA